LCEHGIKLEEKRTSRKENDMNTEAPPDKGYTDCRLGLITFGIIEILAGAICALMAPLMLLAMAFAPARSEMGMSAGMMIPAFLFYVIVAVWLIWLGIGSTICRRWARSILLVSSWIALLFGLSGLIFWLRFSPQLYAEMARQAEASARAMDVMRMVSAVIMAVIYVIAPTVLALFYGNRHVRATCEARDPKLRWTDRCPPQVLALSFLFLFLGFSVLSTSTYNFTMPFFGQIVTGGVGALVALSITVLALWTAWGLFKLRMTAWWTGLIVATALAINGVVTILRGSIMDYYEQLDFPQEQLALFRAMNIEQDWVIRVYMVVWILGLLGYMIYTRRYMRPGAPKAVVNP